jgi:hypothetical protein
MSAKMWTQYTTLPGDTSVKYYSVQLGFLAVDISSHLFQLLYRY